MSQSLFTSQTPVSNDQADGTDSYSMGTYFVPAVDGTITHIRWFFPLSAQPGGEAVKAALFENSGGTKIAGDVSFATPGTPGAWNEVALSSPVAVTAGATYCAAIGTPLRYVASSGGASPWPLTNGDLTAPAVAGRFKSPYSGTVEFPVQNFNGGCYFVDVVFVPDGEDAGDRALSGTLTAPHLTLTGALTRTTPPAVSGVLTLPHLTLTGVLTNDDPVSTEHAHGFPLRTELAAALDTVAGVQGYPRKPAAARTGDAWPRIGVLTHVAPGSWETEWQIVILLPQDEGKQDDWIINRLDDITDVLAPLVWVVNVEVGASADAPALLINCRE